MSKKKMFKKKDPKKLSPYRVEKGGVINATQPNGAVNHASFKEGQVVSLNDSEAEYFLKEKVVSKIDAKVDKGKVSERDTKEGDGPLEVKG